MKRFIFVLISFILFSCPSVAQIQVNAVDIIKQINNGKPVHYENIEIKGDLDFTQLKDTSFGKDEVSSSGRLENGVRNWRNFINVKKYFNIRQPLFFKNCTFTGKIKAYSEHEYEKEKDKITEESRTCFHKEAIFENCKFKKQVDFSKTSFKTGARFNESIFNNKVKFKNGEFLERTDFSSASFKDADFSEAEFIGGIYLTDTKFNGNTEFSNANISRSANFEKAVFKRDLDLNSTALNDLPLTWYIFDNRDKMPTSFIDKIKPPEPVNRKTVWNLFKGCSVYSTLNSTKMRKITEGCYSFWDAEVEIETTKGNWLLSGRVEWFPEEQTFHAYKGSLKDPLGETVAVAELIILHADNPEEYELKRMESRQ
ncbi:pentapeptide repeat-containing protein [candidate division KSB1 bacterium]